ncbi:hypothetical protein C2142_36140 [Streptomyces sp. CB01881]|nr:hypothetical protein C2142_36140 [Streptomyces sp. CB01881]
MALSSMLTNPLRADGVRWWCCSSATFKRITSGRARVERGLFEHVPGAVKGLLQSVAHGLGEGGSAQCAGGESLFERGLPAGFEAVANPVVGEEVAQRVAVAGFTRSAGQVCE